MASPISSDPVVRNNIRDSSSAANYRRKKQKKMMIRRNNNTSTTTRDDGDHDHILAWKSEAQQQVYSSKLLQGLRQLRINSSSDTRGRAVREAADRALAVTAKGRSRWSRAILTNKLKLKFMTKRQRGRAAVTQTRNSRLKKPRVSILRLKTKNLPAVQRKTHVLGRLVPGCRKQALPVVLEEASDYIAALQMQVKAMAALANLLSSS